jgi:predicted nucleotidyltransferase
MTNADILNKKKDIVKVFAELPEVSEIHSFGSINTDNFDQYSDIDLTVVTKDIQLTTEQMLNTLSRIGQVLSVFVIEKSSTSVAYTIFFKELSPFQKLDLGFVSDSKDIKFENSKLEYRSDRVPDLKNTKPVSIEESDVDHKVLDIFIGALRYLKYVKRNEMWPAYKFYRSFVDTYLKFSNKIDPAEQLDLKKFQFIQKQYQNKLNDIIIISSIDQMTKTYVKYLKRYYKEFKYQVTTNNHELIKRIINEFTSK